MAKQFNSELIPSHKASKHVKILSPLRRSRSARKLSRKQNYGRELSLPPLVTRALHTPINVSYNSGLNDRTSKRRHNDRLLKANNAIQIAFDDIYEQRVAERLRRRLVKYEIIDRDGRIKLSNTVPKNRALYYYWATEPAFALDFVDDLVLVTLEDELVPEMLVELIGSLLNREMDYEDATIDDVVLELCMDVATETLWEFGKRDTASLSALRRQHLPIDFVAVAAEEHVIEPLLRVEIRRIVSECCRDLARQHVDFARQYDIWQELINAHIAEVTKDLLESATRELLEEEARDRLLLEATRAPIVDVAVEALRDLWSEHHQLRVEELSDEANDSTVELAILGVLLNWLAIDPTAEPTPHRLLDNALDELMLADLMQEFLRTTNKPP